MVPDVDGGHAAFVRYVAGSAHAGEGFARLQDRARHAVDGFLDDAGAVLADGQGPRVLRPRTGRRRCHRVG